eukprot:TRINITY_DN12565_c0_g1_i18.p1 TRINITY_DN12565_c0_g1~~TRINITY_DN12565_c0_g1_i18.p1  ORF type:complete len:132 (+),score=23.36 TRINITY_DN12565_c0_g1_i18:492-887(+)
MVGSQLVYDPRLTSHSQASNKRRLGVRDCSVDVYSKSLTQPAGSISPSVLAAKGRPRTSTRKGKGTVRLEGALEYSGTSTRPMTTKSQRRSANFRSTGRTQTPSRKRKGKKATRELISKVNSYIRRSYQSS